MAIENWRAEIDEVDRQLLQLMNRRAYLAVEIGACKRRAGLPLCDPERESEVLARVRRLNHGLLDDNAVAEIFRCLIRESLRLQAQAVEVETEMAEVFS